MVKIHLRAFDKESQLSSNPEKAKVLNANLVQQIALRSLHTRSATLSLRTPCLLAENSLLGKPTC